MFILKVLLVLRGILPEVYRKEQCLDFCGCINSIVIMFSESHSMAMVVFEESRIYHTPWMKLVHGLIVLYAQCAQCSIRRFSSLG